MDARNRVRGDRRHGTRPLAARRPPHPSCASVSLGPERGSRARRSPPSRTCCGSFRSRSSTRPTPRPICSTCSTPCRRTTTWASHPSPTPLCIRGHPCSGPWPSNARSLLMNTLTMLTRHVRRVRVHVQVPLLCPVPAALQRRSAQAAPHAPGTVRAHREATGHDRGRHAAHKPLTRIPCWAPKEPLPGDGAVVLDACLRRQRLDGPARVGQRALWQPGDRNARPSGPAQGRARPARSARTRRPPVSDQRARDAPPARAAQVARRSAFERPVAPDF